MVVMNFSNQPQNQVVFFPSAGPWYVRFNSDWSVYGSDFENYGPTSNTVQTTSAQGYDYASVALPPFGALVFSKSQGLPQITAEDSNLNQIPDGWETMFGVTSISADDDSDGLSNSFEIQNGLDPLEKDTATVVLDGVTNSLRAESNNPNVQFLVWATQAKTSSRSPSYTFLSNTVSGPAATNPAGGYLRLTLNLTNLSNSATFFTPNTNLTVADSNRTNWARFYGITNFTDNPDGDVFPHLQEFARGSDPYASNRTALYLAGSDNVWNESNRPMTFLGERLWVLDLPVPKNANREFKFTDGTWVTNWGDNAPPDGIADLGSPNNLSINFSAGGIYRFQVDENLMAYQVLYDGTDANSDGTQDAWVAFYGLTGLNAASTADPDGDGWSNLAELNRGMNPVSSDSSTTPKRMTVTGSMAPPLPFWQPNANNMTWSDQRMQWEWTGTFTNSATLEFKFSQATVNSNWSGGDSWGWNVGASNVGTAIRFGSLNISTPITNGVRYRFAFNDLTGAYSISNYPVSSEWWETNNLPLNGLWSDDTDGDGNNQLIEYALGGNPNSAETNRLVSSWATNSGGTRRLVLRWSQRTNANVQAEWQTNLSGTSWSTVGLAASNIGSVTGGMQSKEASVPIDSTNRKFLRLRVTGP